MTLDEVMALDGRALDAAVAERIEWVGEPWKYSPIDGMPFDRPFPPPVPEFHRDWAAAITVVREWARGLPGRGAQRWAAALFDCVMARTGKAVQDVDYILDAECPDYARAALLVSP